MILQRPFPVLYVLVFIAISLFFCAAIFSPFLDLYPKSIVTYLEKGYLAISLVYLVLCFIPKFRQVDIINENMSSWSIYFFLIPLAAYVFVFYFFAWNSLFLDNQDFTNISSSINHSAKFNGLLRTAYLESGKSGSYLGHHFSPILILLVPFYMGVQSIPDVVFSLLPFLEILNTHFLYAILLALTFLAGMAGWIYFSTKHIGRELTLVSISFFMMMPLPLHLLASFHMEVSVLPLSAFLFWQVQKPNNMLKVILATLLMCLVKEDIPVYLSLYGLYLISYKKTQKAGLVILFISIIYFLIIKIILIPWFADYQSVRWENYWLQSQGSLVQNKWGPSLDILICCGLFLFIQIRYMLFVIIPILLLHALSYQIYHHSFLGHYSYSILPFLFLGLINGLKRYKNIQKDLKIPILGAVVPLILAALFYTASKDRLTPFEPFTKAGLKSGNQLLGKIIPKNSCVFSQSNLSPHLPLHSTALPLLAVQKNYYSIQLSEFYTKPITSVYPKCHTGFVLLSKTRPHIKENQTQYYQNLWKELTDTQKIYYQNEDLVLFKLN